MKKTLSIFGAVLFLISSTATAETLLEVFQKAQRNDPAIREAEANMFAEMQAKPRSRANLLPQIDASAGWENSDSDGSRLQFAGPLIGFQNVNSEQDVDTTSWSVDLRQTLFNTSQWRTYKRADKEVAQAQIDYQAAQQDLIVRVTEAYFDVLAAQDTLGSERASKESIGRQLEQAERRFEVGLIAITDVKEAQAAYDDAVALEISAQRSLASSKEALREITGEYPQELANPGEDFPLIPPKPQIEQDWVDISMQQNLQLESAEIATEISRENIRIARGGRWVNVDLTASVSNSSGDGDGSLEDITGKRDFDVDTDNDNTSYGVQFSLPIYSGGGVSAEIQEEVYRHRATREAYERVARETERQTRDAYLGVIAEIARVRALARSEESNRTALEATEAGYEVGTRTTVDVLDARRSLFLAQTQYSRSKYDYLVNVIRLKQAAGTLNGQDIADLNQWLVTERELPQTPGRGNIPDTNMTPTVIEGSEAVQLKDSGQKASGTVEPTPAPADTE